jgi:hypothetical protein
MGIIFPEKGLFPMVNRQSRMVGGKARAASLVILLCLTTSAGCGYQLRATGEPIGTRISSLAIPLVASTSSSLGFEGDLTRIIREEFISHSKIPLVPKGEAAAVLIGRVYEIKTEPLSYSITQQEVDGQITTHEVTDTRWLRVQLGAKLVDRITGKVIWEDRAMEEKAIFSVTTDPLTNRYNQRKALQVISHSLAKRIYSQTMERF